jgi:phage terminase small subunit
MALANGLTPKQDEFARAYVESGNAAEAYRRAYNAEKTKPNVVHVKASELLANGKVAVRVQQLLERAQRRHDVTIDSVTEELEEARKLALTEKQSSAAVSASLGKAKLHGLIVDKSEVTRKRDVADLSDSELAAIATGRGTGTPAPSNGARGPDPVH